MQPRAVLVPKLPATLVPATSAASAPTLQLPLLPFSVPDRTPPPQPCAPSMPFLPVLREVKLEGLAATDWLQYGGFGDHPQRLQHALAREQGRQTKRAAQCQTQLTEQLKSRQRIMGGVRETSRKVTRTSE